MDFFLEEELLMLIPGLISGIPSTLFGIVTYVLSALAIYTVSRRRGLHKPWLAWIPVVNIWLLGSLSDQYQYVVKGEIKSKRKWLLILSVLLIVLVVVAIVLGMTLLTLLYDGKVNADVVGRVIAALGLVLPVMAVAIACIAIRYMALYDVYCSMDPANAVLYLVLSILFNSTEPFFLFFNRNKDLGMPPRKQQPVYEQTDDYVNVDNSEYV